MLSSFFPASFQSSFFPAVVRLERHRAGDPGGLPCVDVSSILEARRTFLVLRKTGVLVLAEVTVLSTVVVAPYEGGAKERAELVSLDLLEHPGIQFTVHSHYEDCNVPRSTLSSGVCYYNSFFVVV